MKIDYEKLTEITVKSQEELDMIPLDFRGRIYIEFGNNYSPAIVKSKYYYRVEARGNSSVEAWGNSSVEARGNSSVEARGNVQIVDRLTKGKIEISGNARIVYMPKTIEEFMTFYGIEHNKKKATFFKAVHFDGEKYISDYNNDFTYLIGKTIKENCDTDITEDCGCGIHIAHLAWCLDFGKNWNDLAIIEVEVDIANIIMPNDTSGKVRINEVKVIQEVPLEECGLYGRMLAKRKRSD